MKRFWIEYHICILLACIFVGVVTFILSSFSNQSLSEYLYCYLLAVGVTYIVAIVAVPVAMLVSFLNEKIMERL